ncbi:MAG: terminase endonuclease subunit [Gammaproteobacteria bacterium]|nr:terminase endonuclease subunit [Gammaproteobacteria bacterium]
MPSPAQAHFMRVTAAQASASAAVGEPLENATGYELMLAKLAADKRRLKDVQSMERKAEVKREILPEYAPYIEGVLSADSGVQDAVLMTVMVWGIDAGAYDDALVLARYAIKHRLKLPDQYQRTTATLIAEEFADAAKRARDGGDALDAAGLFAVEELTRDQDMPDEVRAKLHKEIGLALGEAQKPLALNHLKRAMQLNDKSGVKKDIEKLERELKNLAAAEGAG